MTPQLGAITKLLEKFTFSAWVVDDDQTIIYINPVMEELFGNLAGEKTSIIYDCGSYEVVSKQIGDAGESSELSISDIPFRCFSCKLDLGEEGRFRVEYFEDISEQKHIYNNMTQALAKINSETKIAKIIQNSILPINDTYWNTIAYNSMYMPADDLGGDFYDLMKLNDDEYLMYIADVAGHGIQSSLLTVFMRERVITNRKAALAGTNELLSKLVLDFCALDLDSMMYVTMVFCKYNKALRELTISNAGHNCFPLIIRNNGRSETIPMSGMPISKIAEGMDYDEETIIINPGDRLILFTDGIVEEVDSTTGQSFGTEGVRKLAEKYHEYDGSYLARKIMDESKKYALISAKDDRSIIIADILA